MKYAFDLTISGVWHAVNGNLRQLFVFATSIVSIFAFSQESTTYRLLNITLDTYQPEHLQINHGRLIWIDKDFDTQTSNLKYYTGAEIFMLDSNLSGLTAAIDNEFIGWNTSFEEVKLFNTRDWSVTTIGESYNPDYKQPVAIAGSKIAYARTAGSGTEILLMDIVSGADTVFSAGIWNLDPSLDHGQLAWVQKFISDTTVSNIYFFDGLSTRLLTNSSATKNSDPLVKDGQVIWLQSEGSLSAVKLFDGDSVITVAQVPQGAVVTGYDLSNGIVIVSVSDTLTDQTEITVYDSGTGLLEVLHDTARISGLHIDNGLICWGWEADEMYFLKLYYLESGITEDWGTVQNPVLDDGQLAWTLGDAVSMMVPVTTSQLSSGNENGWPQSRFKDNDGSRIIWGNLDNSTNARLFYSDGNSSVQLTDSIDYKDFITTNAGFTVWRHDFTNLYLYDGINDPELIVDSLQCENMYLADDLIGFHGFRSDAGNNINQAWLYDIATTDLIQLTLDVSDDITNTFTLVDGGYACWFRDSSGVSMLKLYDGISSLRITDSAVNNEFGFREGKIVWSEQQDGVFQIRMHDVNTALNEQLTDGTNNKYRPETDGKVVIWFEDSPGGTILWYYDIASAIAHKVAYLTPPVARRFWVSNGKVAWSSDGEICVYDGNVISRLTSSAPFNPNLEPYVDQEVVVWNKNNPDPNTNHYGQIFSAKLNALISFDAENISGIAPLTTSFFNRSFQGVRAHLWDFGDGETSMENQPVHTYQNPGVYSVSLSAEGLTGQITEKKINLVRVLADTLTSEVSNHPAEYFMLYQNYPNPFTSATHIQFDLSEEGEVKLGVYSMLGEELSILIHETLYPGSYTVEWNGENYSGGIYLYKIDVNGFIQAKKLQLVK